MTTPFTLTESDRRILSMTDEEFVPHDWEDLSAIIAKNDLGALKRKPSDLLRYLSWSSSTKAQYGTITNYICQVRLKWHLPDPSSSTSAVANTASGATDSGRPVLPFANPIPFADPSDYKILRNDWPYGLAPGIVHLLVWLRTPVSVKENGGDLTEESRVLIEEFVKRVFVGRLEGEGIEGAERRVIWFKNWSALQSVRSLEHVHILVRDVPGHILEEWTE